MLFSRNGMVRSKRPAGPFLLVASLVVMSGIGCGPTDEENAAKAPPRPAASAELDAQFRQSADSFAERVKSGQFDQVAPLLSAELNKKMPVAELAQMTKTGSLAPLTAATPPFRYERAEMNAKGSRATLRLGFETPEEKNYRMNFLFEKGDAGWRINSIVPPAKPGKPMQSGGSTVQSQ